MDGFGVDEGDGEAVGGELDGEGDEGVDVALVGVGDHDCVRPRRIARHCSACFPVGRRRRMSDFGGGERERGRERERERRLRLTCALAFGEEDEMENLSFLNNELFLPLKKKLKKK